MATSVAQSTASIPQSQPAASTTPPKKFLDLCVEELSLEKIASFQNASCWQFVAGTTMVVGFIALAVGALIATHVFAPIYVPFAGLTAIALAFPYTPIVEKFFSASKHAEGEIAKYKKLQHTYQDLTQRTPSDLQLTLLRMGIIWNHIPGMQVSQPENLRRLNPLIAQAKYLEAEIKTYKDGMQLVIDEANRLEAADRPANREAINQNRRAALATEDGILRAKIQAAFTNAVLRNPEATGILNDLGAVSTLTYEDRLLQNAANNLTVNTFLEFRNRNIAPITVADVKNLSVAQLGERLFAAMAA